MGYFSCNAESAAATCDPHHKNRTRPTNKIREFTLHELTAATNTFSADTFLGKGSHGAVYRAVLDDGKLVAAVKKTTFPSVIRNNNNNNCTNASPAENEIEILSRVHSPSLVNLIGFCLHSQHLLVVEYMPNGSLYDLLHTESRPPGWTRRVRFALQVAKALQSLHSSEPPVIHRDIKSSNVLIDEDYKARLSDFGLALRGHVEDIKIRSTPPAGTLGYLDPGYLVPGDLSTKSDVFSFGILLLEIISGRNAIDLNYSPPSVVDWAVPMMKRGDFDGLCDCRIGPPPDQAVIREMALVAARCVRSAAGKRPDIAEVVECLKVVKKRLSSHRIWNNIHRLVTCVDKSRGQQVVEIKRQVIDASEDVVLKTCSSRRVNRVGSRRRNRRVSSVPAVEYGSITVTATPTVVGDRVIRSKSIGSVSEIKVGGDDGDHHHGQVKLRRRAGRVAVKMAAVPVMRLSKSRSMGMLQSPRLVRWDNNNGYVFEFDKL